MGDSFFDSLSSAIDRFLDDYAVDTVAPYSTYPNLGGPARTPAAPVSFDVPQNHGLAGIRASDPAFDVGAFLTRVGEMFSTYHTAFDCGDLKPARRFIDENAWAALAEKARKIGPLPGGPRTFQIRAIRPETAIHENDLDLVRILISAQANGEYDMLCEYWEVIRKRGTVTKSGLDLTHCPNCGAPITGDDPTRCAYCGERLADPALDWVVRKIMVQ